MYRPNNPQYEYHVGTYGHPSKFGYKDFIPMFTGEKFDPYQWAELFKRAGARSAGPVAEHHDGFPMWDSAFGIWNAAKMGTKRDVVGELEKAIRAQNIKYMVAIHHAEN
jgi:alpha-L-fucosidase